MIVAGQHAFLMLLERIESLTQKHQVNVGDLSQVGRWENYFFALISGTNYNALVSFQPVIYGIPYIFKKTRFTNTFSRLKMIFSLDGAYELPVRDAPELRQLLVWRDEPRPALCAQTLPFRRFELEAASTRDRATAARTDNNGVRTCQEISIDQKFQSLGSFDRFFQTFTKF